MHSLLAKLLQKKNIESLDELTPDEKAIYDGYEGVLTKEELTIDDLRVFLTQQIEIIEGKWSSYETDAKEDLIPYHTCYKTLLRLLSSPKLERQRLEDYLTGLLNQ